MFTRLAGLAVTADRRVVLRQLAEISPAMAGLSRQSFANLKSLMRGAFRHCGTDLALARSQQWEIRYRASTALGSARS
jgi:hypothetical protein